MLITLHLAAGTVAVLTGPGGVAIATRPIEPIVGVGAVAMAAPDTLWGTGGECGWLVPWGWYEVHLGEVGTPVATHIFKPTDFFGYLNDYAAGEMAADLTGSAAPGPGFGAPDGVLSSDDFFYFLRLYSL